ncbi:hypothetical protein BST81_10935 [Leptolyngbya sp. 'hensonii']|uniref:hypothetical protein n=1 Tax=Leptolyngbya sp. 'hensonii' TaxID=1922337 RepID=UPI00094F5DD1|nr:hypothetical protein [Leptolyngbya sp. 'hensonii']OLP18388.1 hypothetical protein BST81_10935 [Leptolyngbya sp. 'hensonii']
MNLLVLVALNCPGAALLSPLSTQCYRIVVGAPPRFKMAQGFGITRSKQHNSQKPASQSVQKTQHNSQAHNPKIEAEIETFLNQDQQENSEQHALAWLTGVYNPLGESDQRKARFLDADEEEWLFLAKEVGWLQVEDELSAIYFTAPPPDFDSKQADWYIRPDLTTWLEEPELLREAVQKYPIPVHLMAGAIERYTNRLGWDARKIEAFIREHTDRASSEMTVSDCTAVLLELQRL